jgi:hypothetical protein
MANKTHRLSLPELSEKLLFPRRLQAGSRMAQAGSLSFSFRMALHQTYRDINNYIMLHIARTLKNYRNNRKMARTQVDY